MYALPAEWESKWTIEQRKWKSILRGGLKWGAVMKKPSGHVETRRRGRERGHLSASANTVILHLNTHCVTWQTTSERGGRGWGWGGGGTAQRALALPWTDTHLTHTHTHYCTGSQSAFHCTLLAARTSLCLVKKKQQTNRLTNERTKRRTTHTLDPTGYNKKINRKRNLEYKKSQWHRVLQKAFSQ